MDKDLGTLRAQYALWGYELHRSHSDDGPNVYFPKHDRTILFSSSLSEVRKFSQGIEHQH